MSSIVSLEIEGSPFAMETTGTNLNIKGFAGLENTIEAQSDTAISLTGGTLADEITLMGDGDGTLSGLGGDDYLEGGMGDDTLLGGDGMDTIKGGAGADIMDGGAGADVFEFMASDFEDGSTDLISGFEEGDKIKIMGATTVGYENGMVMIDGEAVIEVEGDIEVTETADGWELF